MSASQRLVDALAGTYSRRHSFDSSFFAGAEISLFIVAIVAVAVLLQLLKGDQVDEGCKPQGRSRDRDNI